MSKIIQRLNKKYLGFSKKVLYYKTKNFLAKRKIMQMPESADKQILLEDAYKIEKEIDDAILEIKTLKYIIENTKY
jgi:hypothetical protein